MTLLSVYLTWIVFVKTYTDKIFCFFLFSLSGMDKSKVFFSVNIMSKSIKMLSSNPFCTSWLTPSTHPKESPIRTNSLLHIKEAHISPGLYNRQRKFIKHFGGLVG